MSNQLLATTVLFILALQQACNCQMYTIQDRRSGMYLDSDDRGNAYARPGMGGHSNRYQKWICERFYEVRNPFDEVCYIRNYATGLYLDTDFNGNVYTRRFNGGNFQKWWFPRYHQEAMINVATEMALGTDFQRLYTMRTFGNFNGHLNWLRTFLQPNGKK